MKNSFIILLILISHHLGFSQIISGEVHYKVSAKESFGSYEASKGGLYNDVKRGILPNIMNLDFLLVFNQTTSEFGLVENLPIDTEDFNTRIAIGLTRGTSLFYTDLNDRVLLEQKELLNEPFIIETTFDQTNWVLTKEKRKIEDFVCYKAIGKREFQNKEMEIKKIEIIAWYCPEIPYSFGPFEAVGLPGLVLEFWTGNFIFSANRLKFNNHDVEIAKPNKGKLISLKEYNNILGKKAIGETRN